MENMAYDIDLLKNRLYGVNLRNLLKSIRDPLWCAIF